MAKVHRSKDHLGADVRAIRVRYALGWLVRALAGLLLAAAYVLLWKQLLAWGDALAAGYHTWAVAPLEAAPVQRSPWAAGLQTALYTLAQALEMAVRLCPLLIPAICAGVVLWLCTLLMAPMKEDSYEILRSGMEGEHQMLDMVKQLPRSCHVFVNKYIPHDGHWSETDLILVGPGGVAVVEVKNWSGLVEGDAADDQVSRGDGRTHYNPVRQVGTHVYRLKNYLLSRGVRVWVVPCVVFVHPKAEPRITGTVQQFLPEERDTVVTTARQFRQSIAWPIEKGRSLSKEQVTQVARAIAAAPDRKD